MKLSEPRLNRSGFHPAYIMDVSTEYGMLLLRSNCGTYQSVSVEGMLTLFGVEYWIQAFINLHSREIELVRGVSVFMRRRYRNSRGYSATHPARKVAHSVITELLTMPELTTLYTLSKELEHQSENNYLDQKRQALLQQLGEVEKEIKNLENDQVSD